MLTNYTLNPPLFPLTFRDANGKFLNLNQSPNTNIPVNHEDTILLSTILSPKYAIIFISSN